MMETTPPQREPVVFVVTAIAVPAVQVLQAEGIVCGFDSSLSFVLAGRYRWRDTSPKLDHAYTQGHYRKQEHKAEHQCQRIVRKNGVDVASQGFVKQGTIDQQHKHKKQGQARSEAHTSELQSLMR